MRNYWKVEKKLISLEEYFLLREKGVKRPFCKNGIGIHPDGVSEIVRVELRCKRCNQIFISQFSQLIKRSCLDLCTKCINHYARSEQNKKRSVDYYENEEYRKKLSEGVKRHYKLGGKDVVEKRIKVRWENFKKEEHIPNFSAKKHRIQNIVCDSYGEAVFVAWKLSEGYEIEKCDFFVEYRYGEKIRHYIPDFKISKNGKVTVIEVKCEYRKKFQKSFDYLQNRVEKGIQRHNNLSTYKESELLLKIEAIETYCNNQGWEFELVTLDNSYFNLLYNRAKRQRFYDKNNKKNDSAV